MFPYRVLNERTDASSETRCRVQEVIEKMGYQSNGLARSMIHQRCYTLDVLTAGIKHISQALLSRQVEGIIWAVPEVDENRQWIDDH
jgi:DNA-binding LacI/PurR family transcriptional regulator